MTLLTEIGNMTEYNIFDRPDLFLKKKSNNTIKYGSCLESITPCLLAVIGEKVSRNGSTERAFKKRNTTKNWTNHMSAVAK